MSMAPLSPEQNPASYAETRSAPKRFHKSLDFSNIGLPVDGGGEKHFRQFHQTRLYITGFSNMLHHGNNAGSAGDTYLISANLPEQFSYKIGGKWQEPLAEFSDVKVNALMQTVGNTFSPELIPSGVNRVQTLKIWNGTEPFDLQLKIPVLDDNYDNSGTNLVEALEFLGSLCLPRKDSALGFYTPPPSPLSFSLSHGGQEMFKFAPTSGRIMLQLGGMLLVDNCVITNVSVDYPNTKALIKHTYADEYATGRGSSYLTPLLAEVTIGITTVEALTANTYSNMLWLKHQTGEGKGNADTDQIYEVWDAGKAAGGRVMEMFSGVADTITGKGNG